MKAKRGMDNCKPQAMKEKEGKKISSPTYSISPAVLLREAVHADLTTSLGGEWKTVEWLQGWQMGKDRGIWKSCPRIIYVLFKVGFYDL